MTVEDLASGTVALLADTVSRYQDLKFIVALHISIHGLYSSQVTMMNTKKSKKGFSDLGSEDVDLTMFTITDLTLTKDKEANLVFMAIKLKRKVVTELVTTFFPTILLLLITFTTIFFDKDLFGDAIAVNLTIMLVMTTIFTSKIEELPPTSDMKMIDFWLIFTLIVPFLEVIIRTSIECVTCLCKICEAEDGEYEKGTLNLYGTGAIAKEEISDKCRKRTLRKCLKFTGLHFSLVLCKPAFLLQRFGSCQSSSSLH